MFLFSISNDKQTVSFNRNLSNEEIEVSDRSGFIAILKEALQCEITEAISVADLFLLTLSEVNVSIPLIKDKIIKHVESINNDYDLISILRSIESRNNDR